MNNPAIVVHYHELWLKGGNRRFFLGKLFTALRAGLPGIPVERIEQPGDRFLVRLGAGAPLDEAIWRGRARDGSCLLRGGAARRARHGSALPGGLGRGGAAALSRPLPCAPSAATKPFRTARMEIESTVGRYLLEKLRASRDATSRVQLKDPDVTCHVEITPGPLLVYARKIPGVGRFAGEYRRAHDLPAFRRIRFRRRRISHDEARRASELRSLLRNGRAARANRRCTWRARSRGTLCPINFERSCIACRSRRSSARSCATRRKVCACCSTGG